MLQLGCLKHWALETEQLTGTPPVTTDTYSSFSWLLSTFYRSVGSILCLPFHFSTPIVLLAGLAVLKPGICFFSCQVSGQMTAPIVRLLQAACRNQLGTMCLPLCCRKSSLSFYTCQFRHVKETRNGLWREEACHWVTQE